MLSVAARSTPLSLSIDLRFRVCCRKTGFGQITYLGLLIDDIANCHGDLEHMSEYISTPDG